MVTGRARAAIRRATREAAKVQFGGLGRQIIDRAFERAGKKFAEAKPYSLRSRALRAPRSTTSSSASDAARFSPPTSRAVFPNFKEERRAGPAVPLNESGWFGLPKAADLVFRVPRVRR